MISLIKFVDKTILPIKQARELKLTYNADVRVGIQDGTIQQMSYNWYHWEGVDCTLVTDDTELGREPTEPYWIDSKKEKISSSSMYKQLPEGSPQYVSIAGEHMVDLLPFMEKCTLEFSIIRSVTPEEENPLPVLLQETLKTVEDKINNLTTLVDSTVQIDFNQKCNVHVGGGLLVTFNDLLLKENCCTDVLMSEFNNGWRVMAVCVQPDQPRPDYILGRYNPKLDVETCKDAMR